MGLQIWLPLIDNTLNNQGLNPMTFSYINNSNKLSFNSAGKIGGCWERTTSNTTDAIKSSTTINLSGSFTMACWAYVTTAGNQNSANGLITNHDHSTNSGAGITVKYISATDARISCNTGNGTDRTYYHYYGTTNIYGAWHHLCLTFDKSTNSLSLWVDGIVEKTITYAQIGGNNHFNIFDWSTGYTHRGEYRPVAKLNDVRVYDHCLSTKEVKELAKGLILHYKLDGKYLSGTGSNLLKNTSNPIDTAGSVYPTGQTVEFDEQKQQNVFVRRNSTTTENYIHSARTVPIEKSTVYTFSCDMWVNDYVSSTEFFWLSDTETNKKTNTGYVNITNQGIAIQKRNEWFHITKTFTTKADDYTGYIRIDNNGSTVDGTEAVLKITNLKLEKGNVETAYSVHPSELYGTNSLEIDCSGYGHHGRSSLVSAAGTSAIYENAAAFPANTSQYIQNDYLRLTENMTFSVWVNFKALTKGFLIDARKSEKGIQPLYFNPDSGIQIFSNVSASGSGGYVLFNPTIGEWYHLACVLTATGSKLYVNGKQMGSTTAGGGQLDSILSIGTRHTISAPSNTLMNDLRIYATALSAEDVKQLYQMKASIANTGTILVYEFDETKTGSNLNITKKGILNSSNISEIPSIADMQTKILDDGSVWGRIFYHKNNAGTTLFTDVNESRNTQQKDKYSRLYLLDKMRGSDGKYEFMLTYPIELAGQYNRWKQTNNPCNEYITPTSDGSAFASGYEAVHIDWTFNYWGGLTRQSANAASNSPCYLSGSVGHGNWFYAIGSKSSWNSSIPGPNIPVTITELWVRLDTLNDITKVSLLDDKFLEAKYIYEF